MSGRVRDGRTALFAAALALAGAGCEPGSLSEKRAAGPTGPNIFLITIESLRTDHVGCYGYERDTTPALDALANEGILYENCYSVTSWTLAAHASLFTGLYPTAANVIFPKDRLDPAYTTIAEALSDAGYETTAIVSGPYLRKAFKLDQGFAEYDDSIAAPPDRKRVGIADITNPQMEEALLAYFDRPREPGRPFFLFAYFWDPHYDYIPPPPYDSMFRPADAKEINLTHYDSPQNPVKKGISPQQLAYVLSQYDGEIRCTDDVLGRVFQLMKNRGLWDNTVVIVTSDHGEEFFEHGKKGHKNNVYVESVLVPLVIKTPGQTAPRRDARLASMVDLLPTMLDFAGVERSFPLLHGYSLREPDVGPPVFCELTTSWYMRNKRTGEKWLESDLWLSLRDGKDRVIGMENERKKQQQWQLFDVRADPRELAPLQDEHADDLRTMQTRVRKWYRYMEKTAATIGERGEAELTPEEIEHLRAIGYLGD
jgi:arylsulfatase A-like enzyme